MNENEVWKDVVGYEGLYKVSDRGNVHSVERKDSRGRRIGGRILKSSDRPDGYLEVKLYKNGERKGKLIHRLVLEAFVENPNNLLEVNHLDENKANNELSNLEWCTREYNNNHGRRNEKVSQKLSLKVRAVNIKTGEVLRFDSTREAGRKGYAGGHVSRACRGVYKSGTTGKLIGDGHLYKGHKWSYDKDNCPTN